MDRKKRTLLMLLMLFVMATVAVAGGFLLWNKQKAPEQTEVNQNLPTPDKDEDDSKKEQTYKILVKNAEGSPIQGIIAAFYDKDGNVVGEPGTTNNMGAITLKTEAKNIASAKVLAVPYEYELNKEFHEFKASKKSVSIVLNENPNAYVAQIGDEVLLFKDAIAKANASETNVTIKLLGDVHYAQSFHLYNVNGKTITLDGQGHTLNLYTTSHSIKVYQNSGTINIQNMKIEHGGLGNLIVVGTTDKETALSSRVLNVNLSNLDIVSDSTHAYTLINTKRMQTINMNLSKVNLVWKTANEVKGGAIMPGVSGMDQVLNLTLKDSVIDVRQANGARGINAANKVTGEINLINTKILTSNGAKPVSKGKMTLTRDAASYLNDGTPDEAKIGDTIYNKLTEAMEAANKSETDVTITLLNDAKIEQHLLFENANGKNIILNGAGYTLTAATTGHSMYVHQKTGTVDIINMKIVHSGEGNVLRIGKKKNTELSEDLVTVNLTNLDILSSSTHEYTLIHTNESQKIDLNMANVNLVWDTEREDIKGGAIMGSVSGLKQELNLTMRDCTVDVTKANGAKGIYAANAATGNVTLYNTVIKTMKTEAVANNNMTLAIDTATAFNNGTADEVAIGTVKYNTLEEALIDANKATTDIKITMLCDVEIYEPIIVNNANGKNITFDGAGHKMTALINTHTFQVNQKAGAVSLSNMDIVHGGTGCVIRIGDRDEKYTEKLIVNLDDLGIASESSYEFGLIQAGYGTMELDLNMADVDLAWKTDAEVQKGAIFAGLSGETTKLNLTMTDCNIDSSKVSGAYGISVESGVTGNLVLNDTNISSNKDSVVDQKMKFTRNTDTKLSTYPTTQVEVGDVVYNEFSEAIADANNSQEDVTLSFLSDEVTFKENITIKNVNGKNITIDGNDKKLVSNKVIFIYQENGTVEVKDLAVEHSSGNPLFRIGEKGKTYSEKLTVNLKNLDVNSTSTRKTGIIEAGFASAKLDLNMADVDLAWETDTTVEKGAILVGTSGVESTVNLTMTNCSVDTSDVAGAYGISAESGVTGNLVLNDTTIASNKDSVVDQKMKFTRNTTSELSTYPTTQVQIGDVIYNELGEAIADANNSQNDVTISFLSDEVTFKENITINNVNGKKITIDGDNKKLVSNKVIFIYQENGTVEVKDMTVKHSSGNPLFRIGEKEKTYAGTLTVNLNNLDINSTSTRKSGVIEAAFATMDLDLDMTNVDLVWKTNTSIEKGVITAGAATNTTFDLTMTDCNIDTSEATGAYGVYVESVVTGNLVLNNTNITSNKDSVVDRNMKFTRDTASTLSTYPTTQVQVGDVIYNELSEAAADANNSQEDVTISFLSNEVTFKTNVDIKNENGKTITLDGCGKTLIPNNAVIRIYQKSGLVEVKNMVIKDHEKNILIRIGNANETYSESDKLIVNLNNLDITSTSNQSKGLIQAGYAAMKLDLNMTDVNLVWEPTSTHAKGAITAGNASITDTTAKTTLNLTMTDCNIDTSKAADGYGIYVESSVQGNLVLNNTTITSNNDAVYDQNMKFTRNSTTVLSKAPTTQVQVGTVIYNELSEAVADANNLQENVTITLLSDIRISSNLTLKNANNKNIVFDGNGHTATVSKPILIYQEKGLVEVKDLVVNHTNDILFRIGNKDTTYSEKLTVNLDKLDITSTSNQSKGLIQAGFAAMELDLNMTGVNLDWNPTSTHAKGAVTAGNAGLTANATVNLTMTGCELDVSGAASGYAIYTEDNATGALELINTKITTTVATPIYNNKMTLSFDKNTTFWKGQTQSVALVDGVQYSDFYAAVNALKVAETDTRMDVVNSFTHDDANGVTIKNNNGYSIIVDGHEHTATVKRAIFIYQEKGTVEVSNLTITHTGGNPLFRIGEKKKTYSNEVIVNLKNLDINSESTIASGMIQAGWANMDFDLNMVDVELIWETNDTNEKDVIVVGYSGSDFISEPKLDLTITGGKLDVFKASGAKIIRATDKAAGEIAFNGTNVITKETNVIANNKMTLSIDKDFNKDTDEHTKFYQGETQSVALVDGVQYSDFYAAVNALKVAEADTRMDIVNNFTHDDTNGVTIKNNNGYSIIVDGHEHTATVKRAIFIYQEKGTVEVSNLTITHTGGNPLFRIGEKKKTYSNKVIVSLKNLGINSESTITSGMIQAGWANMDFDLNMMDVDLNWTTENTSKKNVIVVGYSGNDWISGPTLNLTITDCIFGVSNASEETKIISATNEAKGTIKLINTPIADSLISKNKLTLTRE